MSRLAALFLVCTASVVGIYPASSQAVSSTVEDPAVGQAAVSFLLRQVTINPSAIVPSTGKALPSDGKWSIAKTRPASCPQDAAPCVQVFYTVPEANITCEWVVVPPAGTAVGRILEGSENSGLYLLRKLPQADAASLVRSRPQPSYPAIAQAAHVSGDVVVRIMVNTSGDVKNSVVVSGPELLRAAALEGSKQWKFQPLQVGSYPSAFTTEVTFTYSTRGPGSVSSVKLRP